eukprot:366137-Chlamydomonas_euryale.AAC.3
MCVAVVMVQLQQLLSPGEIQCKTRQGVVWLGLHPHMNCDGPVTGWIQVPHLDLVHNGEAGSGAERSLA